MFIEKKRINVKREVKGAHRRNVKGLGSKLEEGAAMIWVWHAPPDSLGTGVLVPSGGSVGW